MTNSPRPSHVRWVVLALICLAGFVGYVLRTNMSIAGEMMMRDLGLSELQLGTILSAFAWGYGLFQLPGGLFGKMVGARRAMAFLLLTWGILTLLTAVVPSTNHASITLIVGALLCIRFLMGVAQAPLYPITSGISIARWFPRRSWALTNGLGSTALTLGAAMAGPGVAWLSVTFGWRRSFWLTAPLGVLCAGLWWWWYRDDPAEDGKVNQEELTVIRAGRSPEAPGAAAISWLVLLKHRDVLAISASYLCMNYVFYLFFNWFFYYLVDVRHLSPQVGGYFSGAQWIVGSIAASFGGWVCDDLSVRFGARVGCRLTVVAGLLTCAPLLVGGALVTNSVAAVTLLSLSFGFTQLTEGAYWAAAMRIGDAHASATTGLMNTGGNIVGGIGALLVPLLARSFGWVVAMSTGSLFAVAGALLWIWIRADKPFDDIAATGHLAS